jgi:hypothetical protein
LVTFLPEGIAYVLSAMMPAALIHKKIDLRGKIQGGGSPFISHHIKIGQKVALKRYARNTVCPKAICVIAYRYLNITFFKYPYRIYYTLIQLSLHSIFVSLLNQNFTL